MCVIISVGSTFKSVSMDIEGITVEDVIEEKDVFKLTAGRLKLLHFLIQSFTGQEALQIKNF